MASQTERDVLCRETIIETFVLNDTQIQGYQIMVVGVLFDVIKNVL